MALLFSRWRGILASAYELTEDQVSDDAEDVQRWVGPDQGLIAALETRHDWTSESELGPYYLAAVRRALT